MKVLEQESLEGLISNILSYNKDADIQLIQRAYKFAEAAHRGQFRQSGQYYIIHPLSVAMILAKLQMDEVTIAAALLHDVLEDTAVGRQQILDTFQNEELMFLIEAVTKTQVQALGLDGAKSNKAEDFRKLFLAMANDVRVVVIKLADRLHNMMTLGSKGDPEKIKRIAEETLHIYAPLANRLGIYQIKWQLEDLSFKHLESKEYAALAGKMGARRQDREMEVQAIVAELHDFLLSKGIQASLNGRPKHLYSIYSKMNKHGISFEEIYDLAAVRVLVDDRPQCYYVMGLLHEQYQHVPGRLKDYIALPKTNQYQSLHTTLMGLKSRKGPVEVQIRTHDMHRVAELGVASHWAYKEDKKTPGKVSFHDKYSLLRQVFDYSHSTEGHSPAQFLDVLKSEWVSDEVLVFTPKNDVVSISKGATVLDFAYRIHTEVGHQCIGAKVNGKIVPLDTALRTGDIVEILTNKNSRPKRDWLTIVKLGGSKAKIRSYLRKDARAENVEDGHHQLKEEAKKKGIALGAIKNFPVPVLRRFSVKSDEELFELVGNHQATAETVIQALKQELQPVEPVFKPALEKGVLQTTAKRTKDPILVEGQPGLPYKTARCCNPLPGNPIISYMSRKRGLMIHRQSCPYISGQDFSPENFLGASWAEDAQAANPVPLLIQIEDSIGMLGTVLQVVGRHQLNVLAINGKVDSVGQAGFHLTIDLQDEEAFEQLQRDLLEEQGSFPSKWKAGLNRPSPPQRRGNKLKAGIRSQPTRP